MMKIDSLIEKKKLRSRMSDVVISGKAGSHFSALKLNSGKSFTPNIKIIQNTSNLEVGHFS